MNIDFGSISKDFPARPLATQSKRISKARGRTKSYKKGTRTEKENGASTKTVTDFVIHSLIRSYLPAV